MNSRDFAYWLQGFFEIGGENVKSLNEEQVQMIKNHLALVFKKVTPDPSTPLDLGEYCFFKPEKLEPFAFQHLEISC